MEKNVFEKEFELRISDFDCFDKIKPSVILDFFQDVAGEHADILSVGFNDLIKKDLIWVLVRTKYEVIKEPNLYSKIKIKTWPHPKGRIDFDRDYLILDENNNILIKGTSKWVIVNYKTRRLSLTKDIDFKKRMTSVYSKQVEDLELLVPNFKVASAIIHYDETSPHMHIVGVPIKYKNKNGMGKQVGKTDVFTKESLKTLQKKMRVLCIEYFNKEYNLNNTLKPKLKGRNIDINVNDMDDYTLMKEQLEKNQQKLEQANKKSLELKERTNDVKTLVKDLKTTLTSKDKYILKQEDKDRIINFIDKVDKTNNEYQNIKELSITLTNVNEELKYNREQIEILTENNNSLELRVKTLDDKVKKKDDEINELKEENNLLKTSLENLQKLFDRLIKFLKDRLFNKKAKDKYYDFSVDLYAHGIINDKEIKDIKNNYDYSKEKESKHKNDDFEL